jgi:glycosyltransferase involved in cell wall biosynthesis
MKNYRILIPVFNDWDSLLTLLSNIDSLKLNTLGNIKVLIIDDCSTEILKQKINFKSFDNIEIRKNSRNIGHGKSIANGIQCLIEKDDFDYLIIMDGDGEDRPEEIKELILKSINFPSSTITANRIKRSEGLLFKSFYVLHKILTLILTGHLIKFGNYMCIPKQDLNLISSNKNLFVSFSGTISKFIKNKQQIPSIRGVRYHGPTKMSFLKLVKHSLSIMSVFKYEVLFRLSLLLLLCGALIFYYAKNIFLILMLPIVSINLLIIFTVFYLYQKNSTT